MQAYGYEKMVFSYFIHDYNETSYWLLNGLPFTFYKLSLVLHIL